jgi:hypothetical protein
MAEKPENEDIYLTDGHLGKPPVLFYIELSQANRVQSPKTMDKT